MAAKVFKGTNVFMSRNLVPPELFDALHDALKLNGAQVFLCCDPSRNGPDDYHVIASTEHEKFEGLRSNGCKLIGPQCVFSCAKEHRILPNQGFACCLAMDGTNILASGFEKDEKAEIAKMVTAMGGVLLTKASSDVSFVIVKNVLAQKYKWALNNLKKPIVTINWLLQCWKEHRVVPQEVYRVLPFSGLTICVSGIHSDERKEMEKLVMQNGGKYSAELTKRCTHLVCVAPEGDKYKVAKRWGHICIVSRKWFHQSVGRRACLSEESYPVQVSLASSMSISKTVEQHSQGKRTRNSQHTSSSMATASDSETNFSAHDIEPELGNPLPNIHPTFFEAPSISKQENDAPPSLSKQENDPPSDNFQNDLHFGRCIADDSQSENDDLYLSECRILLAGFEASELRRLVDMVRRGGGSRFMSFSEKLTHVLVGNPSEIEVKEIRRLAALGVIYVVKAIWLQECTLRKREVPVLQCHIACDLLLPKDPVIFNKTAATSLTSVKQGKLSGSQLMCDNTGGNKTSESQVSSDMKETKSKVQAGMYNGIANVKLTIFKGMLFRFSSSFPEEQRPEVVIWVNQGGGEIVSDQNGQNVNFIVERHGAMPYLANAVGRTYVTTHWIRSCLQDGCLLDVSSHILYSPLSCQIPLPGFEGYRLSVSQYDKKERQLLRNLCYVLGVKFIEKLNKKVTHLLCKFAYGDKYEAACQWGIHVVTVEWVYECIRQNKVVDLKGFYPKVLTSQDQEGELFHVSQYPTQSVQTTSVDDASQHSSQFLDIKNMQAVTNTERVEKDGRGYSSSGSKKARLLGNDNLKHSLPLVSSKCNSSDKTATEQILTDDSREVSCVVPDVAAAIEDLLEQTSKIQDQKSQEASGHHEDFLSSNTTLLGQRRIDPVSDPDPSQHWVNRLDKKDENPSAKHTIRGIYDCFSETQTDSQVVGYEEDLSGRQMIIDRVRTRSSARDILEQAASSPQ